MPSGERESPACHGLNRPQKKRIEKGTPEMCVRRRLGGGWVGARDALEGKGPQRRPQKPLGRRLEEVAKAVGGRLLSVTNAIEAGTWRQGDSGWV